MKVEVPRSGPEVRGLSDPAEVSVSALSEEEVREIAARVARLKRAYFRKADARAAEGRRRIFPQEGTE